MREIKYRAWVEKEKELVDVITIYFEDRTVTLPIQTSVIAEEWWDKTTWNFEDVVLMQYTGLKDDVNDREIYEGDIMRAYNRLWEQHVTLKVHYLNGCFMFGNYNAHGFFKEHQNIEVIGNIYENPELLEGNK